MLLHHHLSRQWMVPLIAVSSVALLLWSSLFPLNFKHDINNFQWLPFDDFLKGSTWYNLSELIEETLLLASVGYFCAKWWRNYHWASSLLVVLSIGITVMQLFTVGKKPDITLFVMALVVGILLVRLKLFFSQTTLIKEVCLNFGIYKIHLEQIEYSNH